MRSIDVWTSEAKAHLSCDGTVPPRYRNTNFNRHPMKMDLAFDSYLVRPALQPSGPARVVVHGIDDTALNPTNLCIECSTLVSQRRRHD